MVLLLATHADWIPGGPTLIQRMQGKATIADRLAQYGPAVRARLQPGFTRAGVQYPPAKLVLVGLKREKQLQIYAANSDGKMHFVRSYGIVQASGHAGPKLREGDLQVPEGFYRIESLNPNSAYHLALRVNYPNEDDRKHAAQEGRTELGSNIMIHGSNASIGCLAMGDQTAEDLFVLVGDTGREQVRVLLVPADFRKVSPASMLTPKDPTWTAGLYHDLAVALRALPPG